MVGTTRPPESGPEAGEAAAPLIRFDRVERVVHWVNAGLFGILLLTGGALYYEPLSRVVGRRNLVEDIHLYCGLALPVPVVVALAGSWGRALRADLRRFNRWTQADQAWMRAVGRGRERRLLARRDLELGKFNAGQKLNAAFIGGVILVMLASGVVMRWYHPWPLSYRTGATFVHDWVTVAVAIAIVGHILYALRDPEALRSMWRGPISRRWAARHAPAWLAESEAENDLA